jgi:putative ABC transport system ATP-binding protein
VAEVMQDPKIGTMEDMTIEENMSFAYFRGKSRTLIPHNSIKRRSLFKEKLAMLEMKLENRMDELVGNLSGGQRQALALIMAILSDSKVLLLDEITAALDPKMAESVIKLAARIVKEEQRTTLMITHNMDHAIQYGDRTLLLAQGQIIKEYNSDEKKNITPLTLATDFCEH